MSDNSPLALSDAPLYHQKPTEYFYADYAPENADYLKNRPVQASFTEMQQWILGNYGFKAGSMYVSEVKRDHGIHALGTCVYPPPYKTKNFRCPPDKRAASETVKGFAGAAGVGKHVT